MKIFIILASIGLIWASPLVLDNVLISENNGQDILMVNSDRLLRQQKPQIQQQQQKNIQNGLTLIDKNITECYQEDNNNNQASLEDVSKALVSSSIRFGLKMFQTLNQFEDKNSSNGIIFSPVSIWSTLLVTYLGSRGQAETEIRKRLKLENYSKSSISVAFHGISMLRKLKGSSSQTNNQTFTNEIDKIFISDRLEVNQCFADIFPEMVQSMNFYDQPKMALQEINNLVRDSTFGKIDNFLTSDAVTSDTKLIITNAVYFKSFWLNQFKPENTKIEKFFVSPDESHDVSMMNIPTVQILYGVSEALQATAVEIPYSNPEFSMIIVLPEPTRTLDSLIRDITPDSLQELFNNLMDDDVNLKIPKFKFEQEFELAGMLYGLGLTKIFDPRYVNLTQIFTDNEINSKIVLDSVIHKTFIEVNEEGTEAAAATAMLFARSGRPAFPTEFFVNRPFVYFIRENSSNMILFAGTVRRPFLNSQS